MHFVSAPVKYETQNLTPVIYRYHNVHTTHNLVQCILYLCRWQNRSSVLRRRNGYTHYNACQVRVPRLVNIYNIQAPHVAFVACDNTYKLMIFNIFCAFKNFYRNSQEVKQDLMQTVEIFCILLILSTCLKVNTSVCMCASEIAVTLSIAVACCCSQ